MPWAPDSSETEGLDHSKTTSALRSTTNVFKTWKPCGGPEWQVTKTQAGPSQVDTAMWPGPAELPTLHGTMGWH